MAAIQLKIDSSGHSYDHGSYGEVSTSINF